jgi:hypothetical protein
MGTENLGKKLGKEKSEQSRQKTAQAHADAINASKKVQSQHTKAAGREVDKDIAKMKGSRTAASEVDKDIANIKGKKKGK